MTKTQLQVLDSREVLGMDFKVYGDIENPLFLAKEFKKQVKSILKQIRTTGGVVVEDREEEFINTYFQSFSEEIKLGMIQDLKRQNSLIKEQLEEQKPKVEY